MLAQARFGPHASASATATTPKCAARVKASGLRCRTNARPGHLTCGLHKRVPASFDEEGTAPARSKGWVELAVERSCWKAIIVAFCEIPAKDTKKKACPLSADVREHGKWPTFDVDILGDEVVAWTDGSGINNGKPYSRGGIGAYFGEDSSSNIAQPLLPDEPQTNNRGEMKAILLALRVRQNDLRAGRPLRIVTDSAYSIGCFGATGRKCRARGWRNSKKRDAPNVDLIKIALAWRKKYGNLFTLEHVFSHTGKRDANSIGNEHADALAVAGASHAGTLVPMLIPVAPGAPLGAERRHTGAVWARGPDGSSGFAQRRSLAVDA